MNDNDINLRMLSVEEFELTLPFAQELNPSLSLDLLKSRLQVMAHDGFQCVGIFKGNELIGMCGLWIQTRFYCGKMIEPDCVFIKPEYRSLGIGDQLISFVDSLGQKNNCDVSELNCYISNTKGLNFWRKSGYKDLGIHMQKIYEK